MGLALGGAAHAVGWPVARGGSQAITDALMEYLQELGGVVHPGRRIASLNELDAEGGVAARSARYQENHRVLAEGMAALGFEPYLSQEDQSCIITTYRYPADPGFSFEDFYLRLSELGFVIYPGKLSQAPCFRIGTVGRLNSEDIKGLLAAIGTLRSNYA